MILPVLPLTISPNLKAKVPGVAGGWITEKRAQQSVFILCKVILLLRGVKFIWDAGGSLLDMAGLLPGDQYPHMTPRADGEPRENPVVRTDFTVIRKEHGLRDDWR